MSNSIYKSPNLNRRFRQAAKVIAGKIAGINDVVGIFATGGIGRGHSDEFSDLDLIVYANEDSVKEIGSYIAIGQLLYKGLQYDIPVQSYQEAIRRRSPSSYWTQAFRWTLENSIIMYDTDDRLAKLLDDKLVFPKSEQQKLMKKCCHEADELLNYMFPAWEARGWIYNLAHNLRLATENIILWIYAKNRKFQPYLAKWLFYHLENQSVPEAIYFPLIKRLYTQPLATRQQARQTRLDLIKLSQKIGMGIEDVSQKEVLTTNARNWQRASDKTKYYLSW